MDNKIALDICCAPCSIAAIERLRQRFKDCAIIGYVNNSNVYPVEEYNRRLDSIKRIAEYYNLKLFIDSYNPNEWLNEVKGYEKEPENGKRCLICYEYRLRKVALFAKSKKISKFVSTLTTGPMKRADIINSIGETIAKDYGLEFIKDDFKKNNGFMRSVELSKKFKLYRQRYCGCKFSIRQLIRTN